MLKNKTKLDYEYLIKYILNFFFFFFYRGIDKSYFKRGHVAVVTAMMGRACLQNRGLSPTQDSLYGELSTGYGDRGAPKKRFKDSLKKTLGPCHIDPNQWLTLAADHQAWHHTTHHVVSTFEDSHRANFMEIFPQEEGPGSFSNHTRPLTAVTVARLVCPTLAFINPS